MSRPPKKKAKGNRKIVLTPRKKPSKVVLETKVPDSMVTVVSPEGEWLLWGFTRADRESWFVDVYHHKSLVFYETREGAEKVREYGEKLRQVRVKVEYV